MNEILRQPLSLGSVLKEAWTIFLDNFKSILIITLIFAIPLGFIEVYYFPSEEQLFEFGLKHFFFYGFVVPLLLGFISVLSILSIVFITEKTLHSEKINYKKALYLSFMKWVDAIKTDFVASVIFLLAMVLLIIPAVIVGVYMALSTQVVALRNKDGMAALRYSESLIKGRWWKIFGYFMIFYFFSIVPSVVLEMILELFSKSLVVQLVSYIVEDILYSLFVIIPSTIIFLNLDHKKNPQEQENITSGPEAGGSYGLEQGTSLKFKYKKVNVKKEIFLTATILGAWLLYILWSSDSVGIVFFFISGIMAFRYFKFYTKERLTFVRIEENFITYNKSKVETKIRWDAVKKIEFKGYGSENLHSLVINDGVNQIQIGTEIQEFYKIIGFAKSRLGDKFDTTTIPLEYKVKQV